MAFNAGSVVVDVGANTSGFSSAMAAASTSLGKFSKANKGALIGVGALVAGLAAITMGIKKTVEEYADFEKSMSTVKAITNASSDEFIELTDKAKDLGRTTAFTAAQAADGMRFLGMAGFETNEILETIPATLNLAAASGIELARAADIASNVLTGFRLETQESSRVVDVLAKTITTSNVDMEQMAESMKFLAPTAASFGVSIEESSAIVGKFGNAGLQGSIATRAFGTSLVRLADPTKKMKSAIRELGIDFFDAEGKFIGVIETVKELEVALDGATQEQQQAAIATLFGKDALKQWNVLLAEGSESLQDYTNDLKDAGGTAQRMADTQLDNLIGSLTILKSKLSGIAIDIGNIFEPALRGMIDSLIQSEFSAQTLINGFKKLVDFFYPVINTIENRLKPAFEKLFKEIEPHLPVIISSIKFLAKVLGMVLGGALIVVIEYFVLIVKGITRFFEAINKSIRAVKTLWRWLKKIGNFIGDKLTSLFESFGSLPMFNLEGGGFETRAMGGIVQPGETTLVGERGPELVKLPAGSNVIPNGKTKDILGGSININFGGVSVRNDQDIIKIANEVSRVLGRDAELEQLGLTT